MGSEFQARGLPTEAKPNTSRGDVAAVLRPSAGSTVSAAVFSDMTPPAHSADRVRTSSFGTVLTEASTSERLGLASTPSANVGDNSRVSAGNDEAQLVFQSAPSHLWAQDFPGDFIFLIKDTWNKVKRVKFRLRLSPSAKRLLSGAIAGGVSRTAVAPLETIRTHLMVGSTRQRSVAGVCRWILETEGWQGLFRGNGVNVLRVAPSKAIELFTYDTVKRALLTTEGVPPLPVPPSSLAGASAGIASTILMYPLELVKTRLTVQKGVYDGIGDAFFKIARKEGLAGLYRGLLASLVGIIPYAGANYCAYDTLCTLYRKATRKKRIGNIATLIIGSTAGAVAASATFPLEVARKQMQMGALSGRQVYRSTFDCLARILREEGAAGLYRGLAPSCIKLMPAAGISFMCYEALKRVFLEEEEQERQPTAKVHPLAVSPGTDGAAAAPGK